jgi:hypothetical protein
MGFQGPRSLLSREEMTNHTIIEKTSCDNLPQPLFTKEGQFLPFLKGGKEGLVQASIQLWAL